ncbi:carboxylesterase family protein [Novosphingobium sp. MMS21-SN21R]|uniref:carboxylesterase/lipase family protein n=1 Tax=Novosphingobium sp. MMS21-SN21R TaxID=2969298 RepID=UPI0028850582|nr:carboxylesterase family protein [Novosphingobium sp. MMS21-SN21R]MDT0510000.1 carboxylesterase family protein [Novosphingobium sp. MMS21-SN21R]
MIRTALAALLLGLATPALADPVTVDGGMIEGVTLSSGVAAWLGVPFAAPPLRDLRWRAPQPVQPWTGVLHADRFAPECLQPLRGSRQNHYFGNEATSEDCLYLNIWAPKGAAKAPVVVWIYGGAFNVGSASMANYSGEPLARDGVVRVNLAYRVGALGFLAHPDLTAEAGASGNYGLMDQIAALAWVKRNIAKFGGDPANVTIVGQSAGAMSVSLLQASPLAKGLFARAVAMSGSAFGGMLGPIPLATAEAQGTALQNDLGAASLAEMRSLPGDRVIAAATRRDPIVQDGRVITGTVEAVFAARKQAQVPVLMGYTRDESFRPFPEIDNSAALESAVRQRYPQTAPAILKAYTGPTAAAELARDGTVGLQMAQWASAQHGTAPTYAFLFARRQPYAPGITFSDHDPATVGAYHTGDVPYWLRTRDALNLFRQTRTWEPGDQALEDEMASALLSFARTGVPNSPAIGRWPAFNPKKPHLVLLDLKPQTMNWPHFADMPLLAAPPEPRPVTGTRVRD